MYVHWRVRFVIGRPEQLPLHQAPLGRASSIEVGIVWVAHIVVEISQAKNPVSKVPKRRRERI